MVIGILCILGGLIYIICGSIVDSVDNTPFPPFESDKEFWDYHLELSAISDPRKRRAFERRKKNEMIARQRERQYKQTAK